MEAIPFRMPLYLPAQGASETEATIIEWRVAEGDRFQRGQVLAQIDSAKSVFDFEAPCSGLVIRVLRLEGETVPLVEPVLEIETSDPAMREWIPPAAGRDEAATAIGSRRSRRACTRDRGEGVVIQGVGGYLPSRVVTNAELVKGFPELTDQYVYEVTGIRQRRWADDDERPSGMAFKAVAGGHSQLGAGHPRYRRDHRGHDHARHGHPLHRGHPPGTPQSAHRAGLRSQRRLQRLALCRGHGPGHDRLRPGPPRADGGRGDAIAALGRGRSERLFPLWRRRGAAIISGRRRPAIASATCRSAATAAASTWPAARPPATSCPTGTAIRGSASTGTPCSALPRRVFPR